MRETATIINLKPGPRFYKLINWDYKDSDSSKFNLTCKHKEPWSSLAWGCFVRHSKQKALNGHFRVLGPGRAHWL